jgi:hydroxymethylbilane synthase
MISLPIGIGTRGSPMALAQATLIRDKLAQAHQGLCDPTTTEIVVINSLADQVLDRPLADIGGKGCSRRRSSRPCWIGELISRFTR